METSRDYPSQQEPPEEKDFLEGFPCKCIRSGLRWYKVHKINQNPWHFNNKEGGRFNLSSKNGTCYMSNKPEAAIREIIGPDWMRDREVPQALLSDRKISTLYIPRRLTAAKLNDDKCLSYRINAELSVSTPYKISAKWAEKFFKSGFHAIWYLPRFSSGESRSLAMFDLAGERNYKFEAFSTSISHLLGEMGISTIESYRYDGYEVITP